MTDYTRIDPKDYNLDEAPKFRKVVSMPVASTVLAKGGEKITTKHTIDGEEVTEVSGNEAEQGDMIVERSPGDQYIIEKDKFEANYEVDPDNTDQYRSKNKGQAVMVEHDFTIEAPWGGDQNIKAGGIIWRNSDTRETYGNQKYSFEEDFAREGDDGSLMPLSAPLEDQKKWAQEQGGLAHLKDVMQRIEFAEKNEPITRLLKQSEYGDKEWGVDFDKVGDEFSDAIRSNGDASDIIVEGSKAFVEAGSRNGETVSLQDGVDNIRGYLAYDTNVDRNTDAGLAAIQRAEDKLEQDKKLESPVPQNKSGFFQKLLKK